LYIREGFKVDDDEVKHRAGQVEVEATESMTVRLLKTRIMHKLHISPRKILTLRWWGAIMDDEKTLDQEHVADGGLLELSLKNHTQAELEPLKDVQQVRVRVMTGEMVIIEEVTPQTTVGAVKRTIVERKLFGPMIDAKAPPPMELCYSQCFTSSSAPVFGNNMPEESTLGQHGVLHDDLLYLRLPPPPKDDAGKDKGGKKVPPPHMPSPAAAPTTRSPHPVRRCPVPRRTSET